MGKAFLIFILILSGFTATAQKFFQFSSGNLTPPGTGYFLLSGTAALISIPLAGFNILNSNDDLKALPYISSAVGLTQITAGAIFMRKYPKTSIMNVGVGILSLGSGIVGLRFLKKNKLNNTQVQLIQINPETTGLRISHTF